VAFVIAVVSVNSGAKAINGKTDTLVAAAALACAPSKDPFLTARHVAAIPGNPHAPTPNAISTAGIATDPGPSPRSI
jgi:hypothetical protein